MSDGWSAFHLVTVIEKIMIECYINIYSYALKIHLEYLKHYNLSLTSTKHCELFDIHEISVNSLVALFGTESTNQIICW